MNFLDKLGRHPQRFDFHQTLRRLQSLFNDSPRWGTAARPSDEPIRFGQDPSLAFGVSMLTAFVPPVEGNPGRLSVAFFGLFGPHGPLPSHLTEYARDRIRHSGDRTFAAFADLFNHRMLVLFQRAWATAQPTASHDRPSTDRFHAYVAALFGHDSSAGPGPDPTTGTWPKLQYAAHFANSSRHPSGLESLIADYFCVPATIEEFIGQWLELPESSRTALGVSAQVSTLGRTAVLVDACIATIRNFVSCSARSSEPSSSAYCQVAARWSSCGTSCEPTSATSSIGTCASSSLKVKAIRRNSRGGVGLVGTPDSASALWATPSTSSCIRRQAGPNALSRPELRETRDHGS
ncbi:MAG TPA: type VI secretion system baseplate subunit TssG [Polyangiaceae bacterium]